MNSYVHWKSSPFEDALSLKHDCSGCCGMTTSCCMNIFSWYIPLIGLNIINMLPDFILNLVGFLFRFYWSSISLLIATVVDPWSTCWEYSMWFNLIVQFLPDICAYYIIWDAYLDLVPRKKYLDLVDTLGRFSKFSKISISVSRHMPPLNLQIRSKYSSTSTFCFP